MLAAIIGLRNNLTFRIQELHCRYFAFGSLRNTECGFRRRPKVTAHHLPKCGVIEAILYAEFFHCHIFFYEKITQSFHR